MCDVKEPREKHTKTTWWGDYMCDVKEPREKNTHTEKQAGKEIICVV